MFERDKTELRELGVPLESGRHAIDTADGYRIARQDYELGEIDLESDEAAAVALAARLWESPELAEPAHGALVKLRAAGVEVDEDQGRAQPRVRGGEPAFGPLLAAVQAGRAGHVRLPAGRPGGRGRAAHGRAVGRGVLAGPVVRGRPRPRPGGAALVPGVAHRRAGAGDRPVGRGGRCRPSRPAGHGARRGRARAGGRHGAGVGGRGAGVRVAAPRAGRWGRGGTRAGQARRSSWSCGASTRSRAGWRATARTSRCSTRRRCRSGCGRTGKPPRAAHAGAQPAASA